MPVKYQSCVVYQIMDLLLSEALLIRLRCPEINIKSDTLKLYTL